MLIAPRPGGVAIATMVSAVENMGLGHGPGWRVNAARDPLRAPPGGPRRGYDVEMMTVFSKASPMLLKSWMKSTFT